MNVKQVASLAGCSAMLALAGFVAGCHNTNMGDKVAFKSAIDDYFSTRQECVWHDPVKFPAQADTSNDNQTKGFDALTDAGLLKRSSAEKKRFLIGSKQVSNYDISDTGRTTWTTDPTQPGYGNFCYGHREVTTIDGFAAKPDAGENVYTVNFHYDVAHIPAWAATAEMKTAFPIIAADTAEQAGTTTLTRAPNGWQVSGMPPRAGGDSGPVQLPQ
jgi:hypothetical protein